MAEHDNTEQEQEAPVETDAPTTDDAAITLMEVRRLTLNKGDVLVLAVNEKLADQWIERIQEVVAEKFPGVPCLILASPTFDLGVTDLKADYADELAAAFDRVVADGLADRVADAIVESVLPFSGPELDSHREAQRSVARERAKEAFRRVRGD